MLLPPYVDFYLKARDHIIDCCQATFSAPAIAATVAVHELRAESEWRFEVAIGQKIEVRVSISIIGPNL
jgi:hypothetical protein